MAHATPRPTPSWGSRPSSSSRGPHPHPDPPAGAGAQHPSRRDSQFFLCPARPPASLEIGELLAGIGTGPHDSDISHSISTSDSLSTNPLVGQPQHDELNTPDVVPPSPFHFPTTGDLGCAIQGDNLMDAILSASRLEDGGREACSTEPTSPLLITSRADGQLHAVGVSRETVQVPVPVAAVYPVSKSINLLEGEAPNIVLAQPSVVNATVALKTYVPQENASHLTSFGDVNMEDSATSCNNTVITNVPQISMTLASTDPFRMPCNTGSLTNETCGPETPIFMGHQLYAGKIASAENADFRARDDPISLGGYSRVKETVTPPPSSCCPADVSTANDLLFNLDCDTFNLGSFINVNTPTAVQPPEWERESFVSANQTEDAYLYSSDGLPSSVGNLDEMNEDEMKDLDDFCEKMTDDNNFDFLSSGLQNEESSSNTAQSSTSTMELDHLSLLCSSHEPGQLLAPKLVKQKESLDEEHRFIDSNGNPLDILGKTSKSSFWDLGKAEVSSGICDNMSNNSLPVDTDNFGSLPGRPPGPWPGPTIHRMRDGNLDLQNTHALPPLRRPHASHNKKFLDNEKLKEKLQHHLLKTSQERVENVPRPADIVDNSSNRGAGVASMTDAGGDPQQERRPPLPGTQPTKFNFDFDPALKVSSRATPQKLQPGCTIRVEVLNNKIGSRAAQKPLKRLADSSPAIRTKKVKLVMHPSRVKTAFVSVPVASSSSGLNAVASSSSGLNAFAQVRRNISNGTPTVGGKEALVINRAGDNVHSESQKNKFELPVASIGTPLHFVRAKPTNDGSSLKSNTQVSNNLIQLNNVSGRHLIYRPGFSASVSDPKIGATGTQAQASIVLGSSIPAVSQCSQLFASASSVAAACQPPSNVVRLKSASKVTASSQPNPVVTGPSCSGHEAIASTSRAQDEVTNDSDSNDDSFEPESSRRRGKSRPTRVRGSLAGFSRLPRSEQLALDAEKYRRNLKANNLASTKSRLKRKNARLALEREIEEHEQMVVERRRRFEKLKSQYDLMNQMVLCRPCCPAKKGD